MRKKTVIDFVTNYMGLGHMIRDIVIQRAHRLEMARKAVTEQVVNDVSCHL